MNDEQANPSSWHVEKGEALSLSIGPGARALLVVQGRVWLTQSGCSGDLWLQAGQSVELDAGQEVLIEAWPEAQFQLLVPPCAQVRRAVWTWPKLLRSWQPSSSSCVPA